MAANRLHTEEMSRARIEDYLDRVVAPLVASVPYERRCELRAELAEHLEALVEARLELGEDCQAATEAALKQFGNPARIGSQWLGEWRAKPGFPIESLKVALRTFSLATGVSLLCRVLKTSPDFPLSLFLMLSVILPGIAGFGVGLFARERPALASLLGVLVIAVLTSSLGLVEVLAFDALERLVMLPLSAISVMQAFFWAPVGSVCALIGAAARRRLVNTEIELHRA